MFLHRVQSHGLTRRRVLLALVVTVLAVACVAPWWESLWQAVAYEEHRMGMGDPLQTGYYNPVYLRRFDWLPIDSFTPDMVCYMCFYADLGDYDERVDELLADQKRLREYRDYVFNLGADQAIFDDQLRVLKDNPPSHEHCRGSINSNWSDTGLRHTGAENPGRCICLTCYPERQ